MFEFDEYEDFEIEEQEISPEEAVEIFKEMTAPGFRLLKYSLMEIERKLPMLELLKNVDVWTLLQEKPELTAEKAREIVESDPFYTEEQEEEKTGREALFRSWSAVRLEL